jgi:hypothetical protein
VPPTPPPGLVPAFPPGVKPTAPGTTPPAPPAPDSSAPVARPWPVFPGYGAPAYYPPPGYYPPPSYSPPGASLIPPTTLPYEDGQTVPHGYRIKARPVRSLVVAGSVTFGATYLASLLGAAAVVAGSDDGKSFTPLFAPVVGPFITIGTAGSSGAGTLWLVLDGLVQTAGATMLVVGLAADEKFLERAASGEATPLESLAHPQVMMTPGGAALRWML